MILNKLSSYKKLIAKEVFFQLIEKIIRVIFGVIVIKKISSYLGPADFGNLNFIENFFMRYFSDVVLLEKNFGTKIIDLRS